MKYRENAPGATRRELATPMPRARLIPITTVLQAIYDLSGGDASIPELVDALHGRYDGDTMMLYEGGGYGLAEAIDGNPFDEHSGFNQRLSVIADILNSHYWLDADSAVYLDKLPHEILLLKEDGLRLSIILWEFFIPDKNFDHDKFKILTSKSYKPFQEIEFSTLKKNIENGVLELIELAKLERRDVDSLIRKINIPEDSLDGFWVLCYSEGNKISPSDDDSEQTKKYWEAFDRLCEAVPNVSPECLKLLGLADASVEIFLQS